MIRNAQVALIPVFQFGVFSESDLSFFPGAAMDFAGPVHTNGDLYLAGKATVTFHNQLSAYGNVVRTVLANGNSTAANGYTGTIYIPTANATNACSTTTTSCKAMDAPTAASYGDGSVTGGGSSSAQPLSTYNGTNAWYTFSKNTTSHEIINGNYGSTVTNATGTGAVQLSMPFVNGTTHPYEIIRRPSAGEAATSALGQSREYNLAQIHVLLSDDPADFPGGARKDGRPAGERNASDGDRELGLDQKQSLWDFDSYCQYNAWGAIIWQLYLILRRRLERVSRYDQLRRDVLPLK